MNKKVFGRKLSRGRSAREALFVSLISSLLANGKIVTTRAKAKAVKGRIESYILLAKKNSLDVRRRVLAELKNDKKAVGILFAKKFKTVKTVNLKPRLGDNAPMVRIELTEEESKSKNEDVPTKTKRS